MYWGVVHHERRTRNIPDEVCNEIENLNFSLEFLLSMPNYSLDELNSL